ncbi:hypothetical protein ABT340_39490 [Streptosporangium sp. NPDC000239]
METYAETIRTTCERCHGEMTLRVWYLSDDNGRSWAPMEPQPEW